MHFELPLAELIVDYYDQLKSRTAGYASLDYEEIGYRVGELVKLDVLVNAEPVDALSTIVAREKAPGVGRTLTARPGRRLFSRVAIAGFADLAQAIGGSSQPLSGRRLRFLADAGVGLRAEHRLGDTRFTTRLDFPFWVSRPELAQDRGGGDGEGAFRWVFSFQ
jgi:hypothetical protein